MDSYKKDNPENPKAKPASPGGPASQAAAKAGTGKLGDAYVASGTGPLGRTGPLSGSTRRLGSTALDVDKTLEALKTEVDNGSLIVGKLEGRISVMIRAMRIVEKPIDVNQICQGISAGEANFTKQVAKMLQGDPHTTRRVQVALFQWDQAKKGLQQATEAHEKALQYEGLARAQFVESHCQVEKLRGQLYPLINLHVVFRDNALLAQLIPTPKINTADLPPPPPPPSATGSGTLPPPAGPGGTGRLSLPGMAAPSTAQLPPTSAEQAVPAAKSPTGSLANEFKQAEENVQQMVSSLKNATGSLRNKLIGMLGGVPKDDQQK